MFSTILFIYLIIFIFPYFIYKSEKMKKKDGKMGQ